MSAQIPSESRIREDRTAFDDDAARDEPAQFEDPIWIRDRDDPTALRAEIMATRDGLAGTVDALVAKLDIKGRVKDGLRDRRERAGRNASAALAGGRARARHAARAAADIRDQWRRQISRSPLARWMPVRDPATIAGGLVGLMALVAVARAIRRRSHARRERR